MRYFVVIMLTFLVLSANGAPPKKEREKRTVSLVLGSIIKGIILKEAALNLIAQAVNASLAASNMTQPAGASSTMPPPKGGGMMKPPQGSGMMPPPKGAGTMPPPARVEKTNAGQLQGSGGTQSQSGPSRVSIPLPSGLSSGTQQAPADQKEGQSDSEEQTQPSGPSGPSGPGNSAPSGPTASGASESSNDSSAEDDESDGNGGNSNDIEEQTGRLDQSPPQPFSGDPRLSNFFGDSGIGRRSPNSSPNSFAPFQGGRLSFFNQEIPSAESFVRSQDGYEFTNIHQRRDTFNGGRPKPIVRNHGSSSFNTHHYDDFVPESSYQQFYFY